MERQTARVSEAAFDKAGNKYWNDLWKSEDLSRALNPESGGVRNYRRRQLHQFFLQIFKDLPTTSQRLIEVGCAHSYMLPYFARYFGFEASGLERSTAGCETARWMLNREKVDGKVYCGDLFELPDKLQGNFDVVYSAGLVEHFNEPATCVQAMSRLLKAGGMMVTVIPNFAGAMGMALKVLDRPLFEMHVLLDREALASAHRDAGLKVQSCDYFLALHLGVLDIARFRHILRPLSFLITGVFTFVNQYLPLVKPNRFSSPYIICVAIREGTAWGDP